MTTNDDTPQEGANVTDAQTVGIASTTTDPMELDVTVDTLPFEGTTKLQLRGEADRPQRGVSTTAFLPPAAARELGEQLLAAADELAGDD